VVGPLLGLAASGAFKDVLVASSWKKTSYMRFYVIPYDPHTPAQERIRSLYKHAVKAWHTLAPWEKQKWARIVKMRDYNMSGYNYFVKMYIGVEDFPPDPE